MKKLFNKIFAYETLVPALIGTIGYGFGFAITANYELPMFVCIATSLILGGIFDAIGEKIAQNQTVKKSKKDKTYLFIIVYGIYFICSLLIHRIFNYDIDNELFIDIAFVIIFQIITLIIQNIKKKIKAKKRLSK